MRPAQKAVLVIAAQARPAAGEALRQMFLHHAAGELEFDGYLVDGQAVAALHNERRATLGVHVLEDLLESTHLLLALRLDFDVGVVVGEFDVIDRIGGRWQFGVKLTDQVAGNAEQVGHRVFDELGVFDAQQSKVGFLRQILGVGRIREFRAKKALDALAFSLDYGSTATLTRFRPGCSRRARIAFTIRFSGPALVRFLARGTPLVSRSRQRRSISR